MNKKKRTTSGKAKTSVEVPRDIDVGGLDYSIEWVREGLNLDTKTLGLCDNAAQTIGVGYPGKSGAIANTLIHEVLHAIHCERNLKDKDEEELVTLLANGICALIKNNPKLVHFILFMLEEENRHRLFDLGNAN